MIEDADGEDEKGLISESIGVLPRLYSTFNKYSRFSRGLRVVRHK